ncbi:MAG: hypothetical protein ABFS03_14245, partial [Chloroflexota bacterium]
AQKPSLLVLLIAVILGSVSSITLATYLLELSPAWVALLAGAACGFLGFGLGENIGDAIILSLIIGVLVFLFINVGPVIEIVRIVIVPIATGFCVGNVVYGIWKEIST